MQQGFTLTVIESFRAAHSCFDGKGFAGELSGIVSGLVNVRFASDALRALAQRNAADGFVRGVVQSAL